MGDRAADRVRARAAANGKYTPPSPPSSSTWQPTLIRADQVTMRAIRWHWHGRIPAGRITLLSGRPGASKSVATCFIAAVTTRGGLWPANEGIAPSGSVVFLAAEDDPADTVVPRLAAAGADLSKVVLLDGKQSRDPNDPEKVLKLSVTLQDIDLIGEAIGQMPDCKLVVVDPIGSYMGGRVDSHRDTEVRGVLAPLVQMARDRNVAVLLVAHTNKAMNQFADDGVLGSRAFVGVARSVLHFATDPDDIDRKLLLPGKNNLAKELPGLAYRVEADPMVIGHPPKIVWEDETVSGLTADQCLGVAAGAYRESPARARATDLLTELLAEQPVLQSTIEAEAKDAKISWATIRRAADEIGVTSKRRKGKVGEKRPWYWWTGSDWEPPTDDADVDAHDLVSDDEAPRTQTREHLRGKRGRKVAKTPEIPVDAHISDSGEHLRAEEQENSVDAQEAGKQRRCSQKPKVEHLRKNKAKTSNSRVDAHDNSVLGDALQKSPRQKATGTTGSGDPLTDTSALAATLRKAGWTAAEAVAWLVERDEFVPEDELQNTTGGQRQLLLDHLAASEAHR